MHRRHQRGGAGRLAMPARWPCPSCGRSLADAICTHQGTVAWATSEPGVVLLTDTRGAFPVLLDMHAEPVEKVEARALRREQRKWRGRW